MANEEHVAILRKGVEVWNKWREDNPKVRPDLSKADLREADLREANLSIAILSRANLRNADLSEASLIGAYLYRTSLLRAMLTTAHLGSTTLANVQLNNVMGLASVIHHGPSSVGTDTLRLFKGKLPDEFLKGCGLADWEILLPLNLDGYLFEGWKGPLAVEVRKCLAADFTGWEQDDAKFEEQFARVVLALTDSE